LRNTTRVSKSFAFTGTKTKSGALRRTTHLHNGERVIVVSEVVKPSLTSHNEGMSRWTDQEIEAFLDYEDSRANAYLCETQDDEEETE
jgi:hypothetical protein